MEKHFELSDKELEQQFSDTTLAPKLFSHEAHLRLAYIHLLKYGELIAIKNLTSQIRSYAESLGIKGKYNETVTTASIKMILHFIHKSKSSNFSELIVEFPRLKTDFKKLIEAHYSFDVFRSKEAKNTFLNPDKLPFD